MTRRDERDEGGEAAGGGDEHAELVARVREELEHALANYQGEEVVEERAVRRPARKRA
jgi:hypothetical protein